MNTKKAAQITKKRKICENKETLELKESRAQKRNSKEEKEKQEGIVKVEKEVILDSNGKKRSAEWIKQRKKYQADQIADRQIITPQTRVIQFRLRLEPEMKKILEQRISVYCDIIQHAREVVYESLQKNEAWIAGALEGRICLTETRWKSLSTLEQTNLQDQERRKPYRLLQWEVQQEAIKEVMAAFKSCQTNLERGNISGYNLETDLDERLSKKCRRFLWMKFTNRMLTVNPLDGSVDLHWRALGFEKPNPKESCTDSVDRGLYLRDRLLPRIVKDQRIKEKEWTKAWGHTLKTNENGFELRLDTQRNKWYLQYCYESLHLDGPFFPGKAPDWYVKKRSFLFRDGCSRGSFGASDPGFRTPHTVYDFTNRKFIDILDDYLPQLKEMYRRVQRAEDWRLHTNKNPRYESRYQTLCHGPSTEKITKIRKIRRVKRKLENKGRQYRKDWKSRRYDDGGIRFSSESRQQQKLFVKPNSRSIRKAWDRIKTFGRHAHNITANYFVSQFDTFALPEFMTKGMIKKRRRKLGLPPPRFELDESVNHPPPPPPIPAPEAGTFLHKTTRTQAVRYGHFGNRQRIIAKFQSDPYLVKTVAITTEGKILYFRCFRTHYIDSSLRIFHSTTSLSQASSRNHQGKQNMDLSSWYWFSWSS